MNEHAQANVAQEEAISDEASCSPGLKSKKKMKKGVVAGIVAAILVIAGVGFYAWHETPGFCSAICHIPMASYNVTYDQEPGTEGVDKWGNQVSDTSAMLSVSHKVSTAEGGADATCLSCHVPTMSEQISEGMGWISGNYEVVTTSLDGMWAATERTASDLTEARGLDGDSFCLNESCHNMTRDDLIALTSDKEVNPHVAQHGTNECTTCHKGHRASVMYCAQCHTKAEVPEGWITPKEESKLLED